MWSIIACWWGLELVRWAGLGWYRRGGAAYGSAARWSPAGPGLAEPGIRGGWLSPGLAVDVAVGDLDQVLAGLPIVRREVFGNRNRAVTPPGASDRDYQVRLALGDVSRQQVVEQRDQSRVEALELAVLGDVAHDAGIEAGQRPQVGVPVRIG